MDDDVRAELDARGKETRFLALLVGEILTVIADTNRAAADLFEARLSAYAAMEPVAAQIMAAVQAGKDNAEARLCAAKGRLSS